MPRLTMILIFVMWFITACVKKEIPPEPIIPTIAKTPTVKFVFVNRLGFRNDSTRHGFNDTVFQRPCMDVKFYDKKVNLSYLDAICYNRNNSQSYYPMSDSIVFAFSNLEREYGAHIGSYYQFMIDLIWKRPKAPTTTKGLRYHSLGYPNSDTIKVARDTIIKFIYPDDTASGRFLRGVPI